MEIHEAAKRSLAIRIVLWTIAAAIAAISILRLVAWDQLEPLVIINSFTFFLFLLSCVVVLLSIFCNRVTLCLISATLLIAQGLFLAPELEASSPLQGWVANAPTFRLLDANVWTHNPSMVGYERQIQSLRPQLVTMEEMTPKDTAAMADFVSSHGLSSYVQVPSLGASGFFVASKYPLMKPTVISFESHPFLLETEVHLPSGNQKLWVVHTYTPIPSDYFDWQGMMSTLNSQLRQHGTRNLLLVGDFNATWGSRAFRLILDSGLTDAAAAHGDFLQATYPQTIWPVRPLVRIDHILTGNGVSVSDISTRQGPGSDHRELVASVALDRRRISSSSTDGFLIPPSDTSMSSPNVSFDLGPSELLLSIDVGFCNMSTSDLGRCSVYETEAKTTPSTARNSPSAVYWLCESVVTYCTNGTADALAYVRQFSDTTESRAYLQSLKGVNPWVFGYAIDQWSVAIFDRGMSTGERNRLEKSLNAGVYKMKRLNPEVDIQRIF